MLFLALSTWFSWLSTHSAWQAAPASPEAFQTPRGHPSMDTLPTPISSHLPLSQLTTLWVTPDGQSQVFPPPTPPASPPWRGLYGLPGICSLCRRVQYFAFE
jgi:hypothetical protein